MCTQVDQSMFYTFSSLNQIKKKKKKGEKIPIYLNVKEKYNMSLVKNTEYTTF